MKRWQDEQYLSLWQIAYPPEQIVTYKRKKMSLIEACKLADTLYDDVIQRLARGWKLAHALSRTDKQPVKKARDMYPPDQIITYQKKQMPLIEACDLADISYDDVAYRLARGWKIVDALRHYDKYPLKRARS